MIYGITGKFSLHNLNKINICFLFQQRVLIKMNYIMIFTIVSNFSNYASFTFIVKIPDK